MNWLRSLALCLVFWAAGVAPGAAESPSVIASIIAAHQCLAQMKAAAAHDDDGREDVVCDIPVVLDESDLDELFKASLRTAALSDEWKSVAQRYSASITKTLANFRGAECQVKLRVKRAALHAARAADSTEMQLADQPAECQVTTSSRSIEKLSFKFAPRIKWYKGCVDSFALNMGKIDANCKVCYFNRLYVATTLVAVWANRVAPNFRNVINRQLGGSCW